MVAEQPHYQLPLAAALGTDNDKAGLRRILAELDSVGFQELEAIAPVELARHGGRVGRPLPYLCSNDEIYWTKRKAQTGLASELIVNRLASKLGIGPPTTIVRIDPFLATVGNSTRAVGTLNLTHVISSKELGLGTQPGFDAAVVDQESRAGTAVFQSWIDVVDQQVLLRTTDGRVFSYDHGDSFRSLMGGPPRMVVADIAGIRLDWSSASSAALSMVVKIEQLTPTEILEAVSGVPDEDGWQGMFPRRFGIARWLMKRQRLLRNEVIKWTQTTA
jgi:hypothetical protein